MANWLKETFSSAASKDDIVKSRSLNITRITGVVLPVLVGVATAIGELAKAPPFDDSEFQKRLFIVLIVLIGAVTVADILGRSVASLGKRLQVPVATPLPEPWAVRKIKPDAADLPGYVVAFRASNAEDPTTSGEYLFVPSDPAHLPGWLPVDAVTRNQ